MIDTFGVPKCYADKIGEIEDAGYGMVRCPLHRATRRRDFRVLARDVGYLNGAGGAAPSEHGSEDC